MTRIFSISFTVILFIICPSNHTLSFRLFLFKFYGQINKINRGIS